ncbi:MAG: hypothetical protein HYW50_01130 [Candidatus Diapherotrites archaeon]|nr:hypothetical protein [Candidatus Diapherotrites archaeon]
MIGADCVLVKVSPEISLKTHFVRQYFLNKLVSNIKQVLRAKALSGNFIKKGGGRLYIFPQKKENVSKIAKALETVFGIQSVALCIAINSSEKEEIVSRALKVALAEIKSGDSFAVRAKIVGEKNFSGKELEVEVGSLVLQQIKNLKVDLEKPKKKLSIEVTQNYSFFYAGESGCVSGLPLGVEGNVAVFFSGKKTDLLAAFLLMKRGCNVFPVLEKNSKKIKEQLVVLEKWNSFRKFKFSQKKDLNALVEKKDISVKAVVFGFWPLLFFPKELEKKYFGELFA